MIPEKTITELNNYCKNNNKRINVRHGKLNGLFHEDYVYNGYPILLLKVYSYDGVIYHERKTTEFIRRHNVIGG